MLGQNPRALGYNLTAKALVHAKHGGVLPQVNKINGLSPEPTGGLAYT